MLLVIMTLYIHVAAQQIPGQIAFVTNAKGDQTVQVPYIFTNKSNLFMRVYLDRPLAIHLLDLAPALATDSVLKIGNYQFSFFVDDTLIYQSELHPGAPRTADQKNDTIWTKPLIDNQHEGALWSQSVWNRFMHFGGDKVLTEGAHRLRVVLRAYVKTPELKVGDIIASGSLAMVVNREPEIDLSNIALSPVKKYKELKVSSEHFDEARIKKLRGYIEADAFKHVTSVVVLKHGKILLEEYFNGATRDSLHDVRSVGKTYASALTGMAIRDGYLKSVNQTLGGLYDLKNYANYSPAKNRTTLKQLLTMSSLFNGDDEDGGSPGNEENMYPTDNWRKFTLDLPLDTATFHGQWHYFTAGAMLLGSTLNSVIPGGLEKYADLQLFKPLNITQYNWGYTPQYEPNTAGGIRMNALDFAKFGQLYADKGKWAGKQIIPMAWVQESLSHQLPIPGHSNEFYGYLFWNKTYTVGGKAYETYYCTGNGGNKIFVFKDQPLVIVITATAYGAPYGHTQVDRMMQEFILPAVVN